MNKPKYLAFDYETGGISHDRSPLSVYFGVYDENFTLLDELDMLLKPNGGQPYIVDAGALEVNKINLVEHDKKAITVSEAGGKLRELIRTNVPYGSERLTPLGHGIAFDLDFTYEHLLNKTEFQKFVSYRSIDTGIVARALSDAGILDIMQYGSLGKLMECFGIPWSGDIHTAKADTIAAVMVYQAELELLRSLKRGQK